MVLIHFLLVFLFFSNILIVPTIGIWPTDSSARYEFPSLIGKLKTIGMVFTNKFYIILFVCFFPVNRFDCPTGWRYLGGSCYYLSTEANQTCNLLHSNRSNLMQIRNIVQLFYAANILIKNNLSTLMIEIDRNLLKGNKMIL